MDEVRRSVLDVRVVIETQGSEATHEQALVWAAQRIKSAHMNARAGSSVAVRVTGHDGRDFGFAGHGDRMSQVSRDIIDDFFDEADQTNSTVQTT